MFINCGSIDENENSSGAAHFLEHMHFKGTHKRTRDQIEIEIENKGGSLNAYTTRDFTVFILNIHKETLEWGIELLSDILLNSSYPNDLFEKERSTIYLELQECQDDEFNTNMEHSHQCSFSGYSISRPILGMKENIFQLKRDQVLEFHQDNYVGSNFNLMAVGNIQHDDLVKYCDKYFGKARAHSEKSKLADWKYNSDNKKSKPVYKDENNDVDSILSDQKMKIIDLKSAENKKFIPAEVKPVFQPNIMLIEGKNQKTTKIGIYYDAPDWYDPEMYVFLLLQRMIGKSS